MTKFFYSILIFLVTSIAVSAQSNEFNAGIHAGLVASQLDGDTYAGFNKAGLIMGAHVNRNINKKFLYQFALQYTQKGSKYTNKSGAYYKSQLHYVEMPLSIRYKHYKKLDFEAGLVIGYLVSDMEDLDGYGLEEANPEFNSIEFSILPGINYSLSNQIDIRLQYMYSLNAVRPYTGGYESFMDKGQHNNVVLFTLAYKVKGR